MRWPVLCIEHSPRVVRGDISEYGGYGGHCCQQFFLRCHSLWVTALLFSITIEEIGQILRMLLFDFHCETYLLDNSAADPGFFKWMGGAST